MAEPEDENDQIEKHEDDEDTTWFGLDRDDGGEPILAEYRRYAAIMMQYPDTAGEPRYPGLISFIGQTGAGKSSLIKLLIDLKSRDREIDDKLMSAPVIGRAACEIPTSADVHLYVDPASCYSNRPLLYADCEGLEGGDRDPVATNVAKAQPSRTTSNASSATSPAPMLRKLARGTKRWIQWAKRDNDNYEQASKRSFAVAEMYPRIFYAFSDVIVFVLNNPKTLEVVVEKLLDWAATNYSKSINQPSKPHAIIALNKSDNSTPQDQWSSLNATANLLSSTSGQIEKNPTFVKYARMWRTSSIHIETMQDLLRCYYYTVHVVRLPEKSRYQLLHQQRNQLYDVITNCCATSYAMKERRQMLPDVDEFGLYLSLAFDHFSESLDKPFDFVQASLKNQPIPETFADNILILARAVARNCALEGQIKELFEKLTPMIVSCLMLDSARKKRIGRPQDWFDGTTASVESRGQISKESGNNTYRALCYSAISNYFDLHVRCQFLIPHRWKLNKKVPCAVPKRAHYERIHRGYTMAGTHEYLGPFKHTFSLRQFSWENQLLYNLQVLHEDCKRQSNRDFRQEVLDRHAARVRSFYDDGYPFFKVNSICLCCISNPSEHQLECGHLLCGDCVRDFGRLEGKSKIVIDSCPLHPSTTTNSSFLNPTIVQLPPPSSGLRVLVLDGGGVRGIVELCILEALENRLGVTLQRFFDLVVGTSTGGIIALGFGDQLWTIDSCIQRFKDLVDKAFTLRSGQNLPVMKYFQIFVRHSRYETQPLEKALKKVFGAETLLFGRPQHQGAQRLKVAVSATTAAGSMAYVLSNYNTRLSRGLKYKRFRPDDPQDEMKVWEAARSTSAAPGYFKPFSPKLSGGVFPELVDGGVLHNNPVQIAIEESRRLAESSGLSLIPDIVLSIGTGLQSLYTSADSLEDASMQLHGDRRRPWLRNLFTLISYQIQLNNDTESRWLQQQGQETALKGRMHRINLDLERAPPKMDDVKNIASLAHIVNGLVYKNVRLKQYITKIACMLVASSFYFDRDGQPVRGDAASTEVSGFIACRLVSKGEIRGLGKFLSDCDNARASFVVWNMPKDAMDQQVEIQIDRMINTGEYTGPDLRISVPGTDTLTTISLKLPGLCKDQKLFDISGFPRALVKPAV